MRVKIKVYSVLREAFGSGSILMDINRGETLLDVLNTLSERYSAAFREKTGKDLDQALKKCFHIFITGKSIKVPRDLKHELKDNDEIVIIEPLGGGAG